MRGLRFTLAALIGIVTLCGVLFASLRSGSNDWFKLIYTLTLMVLLYSAIAARYRGPFWYGFAVVGWAYYLIGFGSWIGPGTGGQAMNRDVVTAVVPEGVSGFIESREPQGGINTPSLVEMRSHNRRGIVHSALTVLVAIVGGTVAHRMARHSTETSQS